MTDKAFKQYFPAGVEVVWIVIPVFRTIQILLPNGNLKTISAAEVMIDKTTQIEIDLKTIFDKFTPSEETSQD